jgi:hypothetical protein
MMIEIAGYLAILAMFCPAISQNTDLLSIDDKSYIDSEFCFIQKLNKYLFKDYKSNLKPPGVVNIMFGLNLQKVVKLNPQEETLTTNAWVCNFYILFKNLKFLYSFKY